MELFFILCVAVGVIVYLGVKTPNKTTAYAAMDKIIDDIKNIPLNIDKKYSDMKTGIALADTQKKIVITKNGSGKLYDYSDLTGVEVEIDGNQASSANLTGAAVGGILFGGAGAVVGAMTKSKTHKIIKLKLYFSDVHNPTSHIFFLNQRSETSILYPIVKNALIEVDEWYGRMSSILKQQTNTTQTKSVSIADEITKLTQLMVSGVISDEEFTKAKSQLF
jgi:hypothetical protein